MPGCISWRTVGAALFAASATGSFANADVTISSDATQNMSCSGGVCAPTAMNAVLNVGDLEALLASGNVTVTTTGSGVEATNLDVTAALSWSSSSALALQAYQKLTIGAAVAVQGLAGLTLTDNECGQCGFLFFTSSGNITFANLSSTLSINGVSYTLVNSVKGLASAVAGNPSGNFALANSYDASQDGTYTSAPVPTTLNGIFIGLNNAISNLTISDSTPNDVVGLFETMGASGSILYANLRNVSMTTSGSGITVGALVGINDAGGGYNSSGGIVSCVVSGKIHARKMPKTSGGQIVGGVVGLNDGGIVACNAAVDIDTDRDDGYGSFGGLVGTNGLLIAISRASGTVSVGNNAYAGGLIGTNSYMGLVEEDFATGDVTGANGAAAGGFAGQNVGDLGVVYSTGSVSIRGSAKEPSYGGGLVGTDGGVGGGESYSTGKVSGSGANSYVGGSMGSNAAYLVAVYWDTTTSGTATGVGTGSDNVTGLTTKQFRSGLPTGFDPANWAEQKGINKGFPYLLAASIPATAPPNRSTSRNLICARFWASTD